VLLAWALTDQVGGRWPATLAWCEVDEVARSGGVMGES